MTARLTANIVQCIRADRAAGMSFSRLAKKYKIVQSSAYKVAKGLQWKHVK